MLGNGHGGLYKAAAKKENERLRGEGEDQTYLILDLKECKLLGAFHSN